jgi:hypothetical protein
VEAKDRLSRLSLHGLSFSPGDVVEGLVDFASFRLACFLHLNIQPASTTHLLLAAANQLTVIW